jgi:hypothetical protein
MAVLLLPLQGWWALSKPACSGCTSRCRLGNGHLHVLNREPVLLTLWLALHMVQVWPGNQLPRCQLPRGKWQPTTCALLRAAAGSWCVHMQYAAAQALLPLSTVPYTLLLLTVVAPHDVQVWPHEGCALLITWQRLLGVILLDHHPGALLEHMADADACVTWPPGCRCCVWGARGRLCRQPRPPFGLYETTCNVGKDSKLDMRLCRLSCMVICLTVLPLLACVKCMVPPIAAWHPLVRCAAVLLCGSIQHAYSFAPAPHLGS